MRDFKETNLPWIKQIPFEWSEVRIKDIGIARNGLTYKPDNLVDSTIGTIVLRSSNIQNSKLSFEDNVYVNSFPEDLRVKKNDIIICSRNGSVSLVGKCALVEEEIDATFGAFMMRFRTKIKPKFTFYLLQSTIAAYKGFFGTTTVNQLTNSVFGNMLTCLPPLAEQEAIAAYLDKECEKIGREIELLERKADGYRRLRRSLINRAVTREESHYSKYRLKDIFEMRNGYTPSKAVPEFWDGGTIPWFRMEDIRKNGRILSNSIQHITPIAVKSAGLFEANSFILATTATIGEHAWLIADSLANQQFTNLKIRKSLSAHIGLKWMFYKFFDIDEYCKRGCRVTTFAAVDMVELSNMPILLPPIDEQHDIVAYLDEKCGKIDAIVEKIETKIERLKELKRSLINEVVTGQRAINHL